MLKVFQKIQIAAKDLNFDKVVRSFNMLQTNIQTVLDQIVLDPFVDGTTLADIVVSVGSNTINHTLGRKPLGYVLISKDQNGDVWSGQAANKSADKTLILNSNQNMTISLRIF